MNENKIILDAVPKASGTVPLMAALTLFVQWDKLKMAVPFGIRACYAERIPRPLVQRVPKNRSS